MKPTNPIFSSVVQGLNLQTKFRNAFFLTHKSSSIPICQHLTFHKYLLLVLACTCDINAAVWLRHKLHLYNHCAPSTPPQKKLFQVVLFSLLRFQTFNQGAGEIFLLLRGDIHSYSTVFLLLGSIQRQTPHHVEKQISGSVNPRKALLSLQ